MKWKMHILLCFMALACISCRHKELVYPWDAQYELDVEFFWADEDANPAGMIVYFYPTDAGADIYRFELAGKDGGRVALPAGQYNVVAYNSDASGVATGGEDAFGTIYASMTATGSAGRYSAPGVLWRAAETEVDVEACCCCGPGKTGQTLILRPELTTRRYRYVARGAVNLDNARAMYATLGNMATRVRLASGGEAGSGELGFESTIYGTDSCGARFNTFGPAAQPNELTLYALLKDGRTSRFSFDVSGQIVNAPYPFDVTIVLTGLELPPVVPADTVGNGGIVVGVDEWQTIIINLKNT